MNCNFKKFSAFWPLQCPALEELLNLESILDLLFLQILLLKMIVPWIHQKAPKVRRQCFQPGWKFDFRNNWGFQKIKLKLLQYIILWKIRKHSSVIRDQGCWNFLFPAIFLMKDTEAYFSVHTIFLNVLL